MCERENKLSNKIVMRDENIEVIKFNMCCLESSSKFGKNE